jgi:AcrR family transcriptional regulator
MRQKIISKDEIINQALKIIQIEGLKSCSVRRIAKDLNIAVGTIYNYFDSRESFIIEAFNRSWKDTIVKAEKSLLSNDNKYDRLMEFFEIIISDVKKRNGLGAELSLLSGEKAKYYFHKVDISIENIIKKIILNNLKENERNNSLIHWICLIVLDCVKNNKELNNGDKELFKELIVKNE